MEFYRRFLCGFAGVERLQCFIGNNTNASGLGPAGGTPCSFSGGPQSSTLLQPLWCCHTQHSQPAFPQVGAWTCVCTGHTEDFYWTAWRVTGCSHQYSFFRFCLCIYLDFNSLFILVPQIHAVTNFFLFFSMKLKTFHKEMYWSFLAQEILYCMSSQWNFPVKL